MSRPRVHFWHDPWGETACGLFWLGVKVAARWDRVRCPDCRKNRRTKKLAARAPSAPQEGA